MSVTNIRSTWVDGNLYFGGSYGGYSVDGAFVRFKTGVKMHRRPTAEGHAAEVKSEFNATTGSHRCIDSTADWKASPTSGVNIGVSGVSRIKSTFTSTGGSLQGVYGQAAVNGTVNGSTVHVNAFYGLIEAGGVYTKVNRVAVAWLDSHLASTITSGSSCFLYITNNGSTTYDEAIYIYAGNKITNLFTLNTAGGGLLSASTSGGSTLNFSDYRLIKVDLGGTTHYLVAAQTIA